jgi:hypothetical protein
MENGEIHDAKIDFSPLNHPNDSIPMIGLVWMAVTYDTSRDHGVIEVH